MSPSQNNVSNSSDFVGSSPGLNSIDTKEQQDTLPRPSLFNEWRFRPGAYATREFVHEIAILFESIIVQLGPDQSGDADSRTILLDGLRSSLSHESPEATLPLADWDSDQPSALTRHISRIGQTLFQYAAEASRSVVPGDPSLTVHSSCKGHKWTPAAAQLLCGPRGSRVLMMLYNEWLHQLTCLRDFLIAFDNFEEVVLNLDNPSRPGTRPMEDVREALLAQVKSGQVSRGVLLETAKVLTGPALPAGGYGFQYSQGLVLPADLFSRPTSGRLLHYSPTLIVHEANQQPVLFASAPACLGG